ncbi:MAG: hypothetical protein QJT81_06095 [Candidatus Thiothrix putei]|uniref:Tetratricopeptide repeat protein n=1 Tax=Candidatus Thiothrix putei TaxID=3080811 RepID=A0AA95HDZ6_9GAMM|nr:MAG: hypothetical protein QJT81_06095 [Candidatus Thiothrix putei]
MLPLHTMKPDHSAVQSELERILTSRCFRSSKALQKFLHYIVTETLAGHTDHLTQHCIAVQGLGKSTHFDDIDNPLVRIQAGRLRKQLADYYATEGRFNAVRITLPTGSYQPIFTKHLQQNKAIPAPLEVDDGTTQGPNIVCIPRSFMTEASSEPFIVRLAHDYVAALAKFSFCQVTLANTSWQSDIWQQSGADFILFFDLYPTESGYSLKCSLVHGLNRQIIWGHHFPLEKSYPTPASINPIFKRIAHDTLNYETGVAHHYWVRQQLDSGKPIAAQHQVLVAVRQCLWKPSPTTFRASWETCRRRIEQAPNDVPALFVYINHCLTEYGLKYHVIESVETKVVHAVNALLELAPANAYSHAYHAAACLFNGDSECCQIALEKAQALNTLDSYLNIHLGLIYIGLGKWQTGAQLMQDSIDISPTYANWYHIPLSICHYREGRYLTQQS